MTIRGIRLGRAQFTIVVVAVLVLIPALAYLVSPADFDLWRMRRYDLPGFESTLGFTAGYVKLPPASGVAHPVFVITSVSPGGVFWEAGVREGDVPVGYKHGFELGFLYDLVWGRRKGFATLTLTPAEAAAKGNFDVHREVRVVLPRPARLPAT